MSALLYVFAAVVGVLNNVQAGANVTLNKTLGQPILAALVVAAANVATYLALVPFFGLALPETGRVSSVPWWAWTGGALGGVYVLVTLLVAGRIGAGAFTGLSVTAGIVTSILLDHFGWVGFEVHPAGPGRIVGGVLMIAGVALVCFF